MKSLNNGDWSQSRFKIIMGFMTSLLDIRLRVMDFFLTLMLEIRNMTYDSISVTKCHGSRSCVTEGHVKHSSPGKESINKC